MLTNAAGLYLFGGLPQGDYIVRVTGPIGYTSTIDTFDATDNANPNTNTNNNDNGIGTGAGVVSSAVVTLTPGSAGAQNNNIVTLNTGTTRNPTVDFGFVQANAGIIKSVTPAQATICELVTYIVQVQIPPGSFDNAQLVDTMETGLSLFDCQSITGVGVTTSLAGGFGCAGNVTTAPGTDVDIDRIATFNLGNLSNTGETDGTITITYRAIVLDIATNRGAATQTVLDNSALFSWTGGTLGPVTRAVTLVEPDLQIVKSANTNFVAVGTDVEFTLTESATRRTVVDKIINIDQSPYQPDTIDEFYDNVIAYNGVGIEFNDQARIGNVFKGNVVKGNLTSLAVRSRASAIKQTFEGNYWEDYEGFDRDRDGIGDTPYVVHAYADRLWMDVPLVQFFKGSPMLEFLDFLERLAPFTDPDIIMRDPKPRMSEEATR